MTNLSNDRLQSMESWTDDNGGKVLPELMRRVTSWIDGLEKIYKEKYDETMLEPMILPCGVDEINVEWTIFKDDIREASLLAGFIHDDITDYYGEDFRTRETVHGLLTGSNKEMETIAEFLHVHLHDFTASELEQSIMFGIERLDSCYENDWDGDGANAITPDMASRAFMLARELESAYRSKHGGSMPVPDFFPYCGDPHHVCIEWSPGKGERDCNFSLLVSINETGISYHGEQDVRENGINIKGTSPREKAIACITHFMHECNDRRISARKNDG